MSQTENKAAVADFGESECHTTGKYGKYASELRKGRFLISSQILPFIGTDVEYRAWTAKQACSICKSRPARYWPLRRYVKPGLAIIPDYHGIPLAPELCLLLQDGSETTKSLLEYYFVLEPDPDDSEVDDWISKTATANLHDWAWYALKSRLGYDHWNDVPPQLVHDWARENQILNLLPQCYRNYRYEEETITH